MFREFSCPCGSVKITTLAPPLMMTVCHCSDCTRIHSAPMIEAAIFKETDVTISGATDTFTSDPDREDKTVRHSCAKCHVPVFIHPPKQFGVRTLFPPTCSDRGVGWWKPMAHVYCEGRLDTFLTPACIMDGVPKYLDRPGLMMGSDRLIPVPDGGALQSLIEPLRAKYWSFWILTALLVAGARNYLYHRSA
ncbi:hypothetical protein M427DRAFT_53503 [Gonapodya prolifera JEL478]|uniref:CENP-V/GFA domain-containing protein n=1 Tax=Gonapodya prolifera (strain JEL478) TaxID=1344416 RepID=A0A139ARA6_GONPJ|nr:hypothetical protein M427DRAFT_53503 [Gonapodya prolifera JEL478]|eukprot:KXS19053.1 hypothetical protein M427DRAFT_53503 [Gonapodya prolifera JEL478]